MNKDEIHFFVNQNVRAFDICSPPLPILNQITGDFRVTTVSMSTTNACSFTVAQLLFLIKLMVATADESSCSVTKYLATPTEAMYTTLQTSLWKRFRECILQWFFVLDGFRGTVVALFSKQVKSMAGV